MLRIAANNEVVRVLCNRLINAGKRTLFLLTFNGAGWCTAAYIALHLSQGRDEENQENSCGNSSRSAVITKPLLVPIDFECVKKIELS